MECVAVALRASFHKVPITVWTVPRSCRGTDMGWWFLVSMVEVKVATEGLSLPLEMHNAR